MKNFLCKIGLHDWKILELENYAQLEENIRVEIESKNCKCKRPCMCHIPMRVELVGYFPSRFKDYYEKKVCRRCKKLVDKITPYKEKIKSKVLKEIELEKKYK